MTLTPGSRLGPYEVVAPIGSGGMGEVFKARDTRLERSVAIKILPAEFAQDAQLRLRFEREAKTISQLSHPNICTLYDVGDGYLVMELLEGETLADRIAKGPLPLDQVIRIGTEIANALDRAHKAGVVHRDLKPSNVMLTKSGAKLLDFGLATDHAAGLGPRASGITVQKALTEEGTLLGTFQYMAPEQLEGSQADARTDIFALGVLLYEMATGKHAFEGRSKASLVALILTAEPPPVSASAAASPPALDRLIHTCLDKDPDERWQSAHDVRLELQSLKDSAGVSDQPRRRRVNISGIAAALLAITTIVATWMLIRDWVAHRNEPPLRTSIVPPDKATFSFAGLTGAPPAISPDGRKVVFGATLDGKTMLWLRPLSSSSAQVLPGTEGGIYPFWSPDSRSIGFFADGKLKKMNIAGSPVIVCDAEDGRGGSWSPDGTTILFAGRFTKILRVSSSGGDPVAVTELSHDNLDLTHRWPYFLPDGRHFLYLASPTGSEDPSNAICVGSLAGGMRKVLLHATANAEYCRHRIIYVRDGIITAQNFDEKKLELTGDPFTVPEQQVAFDVSVGRSEYSVSAAGLLLYESGNAVAKSQLVWTDRNGKALSTIGGPDVYGPPVLKADNRSVAVPIRIPVPQNIWMFDVERGAKSRLTFGAVRDGSPVWSPDGTRLAYGSARKGGFVDLHLKDLRTGVDTILISNDADKQPTSWSPDGEILFYNFVSRGGTLTDIHYISVADRKDHVYLASPQVESGARMSPDGKWVVYQSQESSRWEVYIAPFPPTGSKWQVSVGGGLNPRWRRDGKEIYYSTADAKLVAVPIKPGPTPDIGKPATLFAVRSPVSIVMYDVTSDGQRFLVNTRAGDDTAQPPLTLVQNFDNELRAAEEHRD